MLKKSCCFCCCCWTTCLCSYYFIVCVFLHEESRNEKAVRNSMNSFAALKCKVYINSKGNQNQTGHQSRLLELEAECWEKLDLILIISDEEKKNCVGGNKIGHCKWNRGKKKLIPIRIGFKSSILFIIW